MTRPQLSDREVFRLTRYAHLTLTPLIAEAQAVEPSIEFSIAMQFTNTEVRNGEGHVDVYGHWERDGMFLYITWNQTEADIDRVAIDIKSAIEELKLEAAA